MTAVSGPALGPGRPLGQPPDRQRRDRHTDRYVSTYSSLSRQVRRTGLLRRRYGHYWMQIIGAVSAFLGICYGAVLLGDSWFQLVLAALLALVCAQFGFLGHDAAHRQIFASHRWNAWAAVVLSGVFTGLSYDWWMGKHNRHHAAPNQEGRDPDIAPGALAFTPAVVNARARLGARLSHYQGWFFFPLLMLQGLNLHAQSIRVVLRRSAPAGHRRVEAVLIGGRLGGYLAGLFWLLPPGKAAAFAAVQLALFGVLLGASFAPNHKGMPIIPATMKLDFLRRQVLTSRNVRGGPLTDFMMGGLNYQIEHHLFPNMPRPNLRRARPLVRAHCAAHGIPYTETGLLESYRIVIRHLNAVGRGASQVFLCPLAAQFRR